jgi:hypothetical protein
MKITVCVCIYVNANALTGRVTISITNCLLLKLTAAIRTLHYITECVR